MATLRFQIVVSNCDDHLRNHGFLLTPCGWTLSPAYEVNPDEQGISLKLNISEDDNSLDFKLALNVAPYFGVDGKQADHILKGIRIVVSAWCEVRYSIPHMEQEMMTRASRSE